MEIKNAVIKKATITNDDHGCLTIWLQLDYGRILQGFGGYVVYLPKSFENHEMKSDAGHFIWRIMEIAGVSEWGDLIGKTIRAKAEHTCIYAIGHIIKDDWFSPSEDFAE